MSDLVQFDKVPVILFIIDDEGTIINQNELAREFIGKSKKGYLSRNFLDFVDDEKNTLLSILKKSTDQTFPQSIEVKFKGKNNKSFYTFLSISNYFYAKTNQNLFIFSVADITNQKLLGVDENYNPRCHPSSGIFLFSANDNQLLTSFLTIL